MLRPLKSTSTLVCPRSNFNVCMTATNAPIASLMASLRLWACASTLSGRRTAVCSCYTGCSANATAHRGMRQSGKAAAAMTKLHLMLDRSACWCWLKHLDSRTPPILPSAEHHGKWKHHQSKCQSTTESHCAEARQHWH